MTKSSPIVGAVHVIGAMIAIGSNFLWWGYSSPETRMRWAPLCAADTIPSDIGVGLEFFRSKVDSFQIRTWSEVMPLPDGAQKMLASHDARFQLVDVNPAFQNRSSEILLLIKSGTDSFEYSLERPKKDDVQPVAASPDLPNAGIFPYRTGLALLSTSLIRQGASTGYLCLSDLGRSEP